MNTRLHFLDNLRSFLIFLVVLYHSSIAFQPGFENEWIVSDSMKSNAIGLIGLYGDVFGMFMLFFISGYFMRISVRNHSSWSLVVNKFRRTIIPWLVAVLTLIPAYKYIYLYSRGLPQEEWYTYFHWFQRAGSEMNLFNNDPTQQWLWFLPVLFLFQMLYLALTKTKLFSLELNLKKAVVLVFGIGLIYSLVISGLDMRGWTYTWLLDFQTERLPIYFTVFLLGSLCNKLQVFDTDVRNKKWLIITNVVMAVGITIFTIVAMNLFFNIVYPDRNLFIVSRWFDVTTYYVCLLLLMLCFTYILLDLFQYKINGNGRMWKYLNANSYLVYIIHMIVLGGLALPFMTFKWPVFVKFPILFIATFLVSNLASQGLRKVLK